MKTFTKAQLDAARARLDVAQGITDEVVETAARAMYEGSVRFLPWKETLAADKELTRRLARIALRAVLPIAPVHKCDTCACSHVCSFRRAFEEPFVSEPLVHVRGVIVECDQWREDVKAREVAEHAGG